MNDTRDATLTTGSLESTGPDLRGELRDVLQAATEPQTAAQLRTKLGGRKKPAADAVREALEQLVASGEIYRWEPVRGKTERYWTDDPDIPARRALELDLGEAEEPLTAAQLRTRAGGHRGLGTIQRLLEGLVESGQAHRYGPARGDQARYWAVGPDRYAKQVLLKALKAGKGKSGGPLSWPELVKATKTPLKGFDADQLSQYLQDLIDEGKAHKALKFTATAPERFSADPPDLVGLVRESFREIYQKFARAGVSSADVDQAARAVLGVSTRRPDVLDGESIDQAVIEGFAELRRERYSQTGLVPVPELRRSIRDRLGPEAARHDVLDGRILGLVKAGRLRLLPLNDARLISPEDRNDAIPGAQETWYYLEARS